MPQYISVGRIVCGAAGEAGREVIAPGTQFDPAEQGMDEKEVERLIAAGALRLAPEAEVAPADGPREPTPPAAGAPRGTAPVAESDVISREPPPDESA